MDHSHDDHHDEHGGLGKYVVVFLCLCVLTACSFMTVSPFWPFEKGPTWIFMMGVSCAKAMLVILFFMHLKWEANWKYVLTIPAAMMSMFLVLMLVPDVGLRGYWQSEERATYAAAPDVTGHEAEHGEAHEDHGDLHEEHGAHDAHEEPAQH